MSTSDKKSNTDFSQESQDNISVWNLIDSDPDIFTDMIWSYGIREVSAEDIKTLADISKLAANSTYGIIHGFKCNQNQSPVDRDEPDQDSEGICFSHQVAVNSCATHSLVNILNNADINRDGLIKEFIDRTRNMDSIERGFDIRDSESFRRIHNSYRSPENTGAILGGGQQYDDEDISHFVSYIFKNGFIWKLDSLNINPTKVMKFENEEEWPEALEHILVEKIGSGYSSNSFLVIKKDRIAEIEESLANMVLCEYNLGAQLEEMTAAVYETFISGILPPSEFNYKVIMIYEDREQTRETITIHERYLNRLKYEMAERISRVKKLKISHSSTHSSTETFANKSGAGSTELQDSSETCTTKEKSRLSMLDQKSKNIAKSSKKSKSKKGKQVAITKALQETGHGESKATTSKNKKRSKQKGESSEPKEKGTKKRKRNDNDEGKDSKKSTKHKHSRE